jgi:hypothetical protein
MQGKMLSELDFEQWSLDAGAAELAAYQAGRGAAPTYMNAQGVGHLIVPEPRETILQFERAGLGGGHETGALEAFVENNPNYWIELDGPEKVGADGVTYRRFTQYMWDPTAGPPPPRPAGLRPGGPPPPGAGWKAAAEPKTTADDLHALMARADDELAAFAAGGGTIPTSAAFPVGTDPPIIVILFGTPPEITTCFPDAAWF